jgi:hypothetical protein
LTIAVARACKGKVVALPRTFNHTTGSKVSTQQTGFSEAAWGKATRGFAKSARSLSDAKIKAIVKHAQEFAMPRNSPTEVINIDDNDDERAHLVDNSSSDAEGMYPFNNPSRTYH